MRQYHLLRTAVETPVVDSAVSRDLHRAAEIEAAHLDEPEAAVGPIVAEYGQHGELGTAIATALAAERDGSAAGTFGHINRHLDGGESLG